MRCYGFERPELFDTVVASFEACRLGAQVTLTLCCRVSHDVCLRLRRINADLFCCPLPTLIAIACLLLFGLTRFRIARTHSTCCNSKS